MATTIVQLTPKEYSELSEFADKYWKVNRCFSDTVYRLVVEGAISKSDAYHIIREAFDVPDDRPIYVYKQVAGRVANEMYLGGTIT